MAVTIVDEVQTCIECGGPVACHVCDACAEHCCMADPDRCWEASEQFRLAYKTVTDPDTGQRMPIHQAPKPARLADLAHAALLI